MHRLAISVLMTSLAVILGTTGPALAQTPVAVAPAGQLSGATGDTVALNFVNADIDQVIKAIGIISGRNFLIDPRVKGTLNIVSATPLPRELAYQVLLSSLRLQGFAAVEANGVTTILPEADAKLHGTPVEVQLAKGQGAVSRPAGKASGDRLMTQVFALKNESALQLVPILRPLIAANNSIAVNPNNNTLVITDYADNIARLTRIIEGVDRPQSDVVAIQARHASAIDLASTLNRLFGDGTGGAGTTGAAGAAGGDASQRFLAMAEHRTNQVLIRSGNASKIAGARQLLARLDIPGVNGNFHVVFLKNSEASKVAETLRAVLSGELATNAPAPGLSNTANGTQNLAPNSGLTATAGIGPGAGGSLAPSTGNIAQTGGSIVQADVASNALIITAPEPVYNSLRLVIDQIDRRRAQVFVEALIAEVSAERLAEFGIQWQTTGGQGSVGDPSVIGGTNFGVAGQNIIGAAINPASLARGLNLAVAAGTVTIAGVEILNLGMLARALETDADAKILSTPNLMTLDNEEARIVVGQNVPFITGQYTNTGGGTTPANPFQTIERRDVGLTLRVRPQISEGGTIKMQIAQEISTLVGTTLNNPTGPVTNKRSIDTTVMADDGTIIALGGLIQDVYEGGIEKVPLLGDIPFLGWLFRYDSRKRQRSNLIVFLRPEILRDRDSYADITKRRYDRVIDDQMRPDGGERLMINEQSQPMPVLKGSVPWGALDGLPTPATFR
jgi:general secretion pathway protein D